MDPIEKMENPNALAVAEKISLLIEKAPAGGIFHGGDLSPVAGLQVDGFADVAGFSIELGGKVFDVAVQRARD